MNYPIALQPANLLVEGPVVDVAAALLEAARGIIEVHETVAMDGGKPLTEQDYNALAAMHEQLAGAHENAALEIKVKFPSALQAVSAHGDAMGAHEEAARVARMMTSIVPDMKWDGHHGEIRPASWNSENKVWRKAHRAFLMSKNAYDQTAFHTGSVLMDENNNLDFLKGGPGSGRHAAALDLVEGTQGQLASVLKPIMSPHPYLSPSEAEEYAQRHDAAARLHRLQKDNLKVLAQQAVDNYNPILMGGFRKAAEAHADAAWAHEDAASVFRGKDASDEEDYIRQCGKAMERAEDESNVASAQTQSALQHAASVGFDPRGDYTVSMPNANGDPVLVATVTHDSINKGGPGSGRHPEGDSVVPEGCGHRDFDPSVAVSHIGQMNVLAISGGRVGVLTQKGRPVGVELPVSSGYKVRVFLHDADVYVVQRVMVRAGKTTLKGQEEAYADMVGDAAYRAGMYKNVPFGNQG